MTGAKSNILEAIGRTPIVKLQSSRATCPRDIYVKCEYLNPGGSMKDRVALNIIKDAERRGLLRPGGTIVEATSGNTGAGLALVAAIRGYKCVFVMPDKMSQEKIAGAARVRRARRRSARPPSSPRIRAATTRSRSASPEETPNASTRTSTTTPPTPTRTTSRRRRRSGSRRAASSTCSSPAWARAAPSRGCGSYLQGEEARHPARRRRSGRLALLRVRQDAGGSPSPSPTRSRASARTSFPAR